MKHLAKIIVLLLAFSTALRANPGWKKCDVPARRAMWVWGGTGTNSELPEDRTAPVSKALIQKNKQAKKLWDGEGRRLRFQQNYKGIQDLLLDFCENKSINELYMFGSTYQWSKKDLGAGRVPDEAFWVTFNTAAKERGIRVWLMFYSWDNSDDPRLKRNKAGVLEHAIAVHNFNKAHPDCPFVGIHCDQEPRDIECVAGLLASMKEAQEWIDENHAGILCSQALRPAWKGQKLNWNGSEKPILEHFVDTISHTALMCYDNRLPILQSWADNLIDYSTKVGKRASIGFELNNLYDAWPTAKHETWWRKIHDEPAETRLQVNHNDSIVTCADAMDLVDRRQSAKAGYDRIVIHSYNGYFEHCFGVPPRDYVSSLPRGYVSRKVKPGKVDLTKDTRPKYEASGK